MSQPYRHPFASGDSVAERRAKNAEEFRKAERAERHRQDADREWDRHCERVQYGAFGFFAAAAAIGFGVSL